MQQLTSSSGLSFSSTMTVYCSDYVQYNLSQMPVRQLSHSVIRYVELVSYTRHPILVVVLVLSQSHVVQHRGISHRVPWPSKRSPVVPTAIDESRPHQPQNEDRAYNYTWMNILVWFLMSPLYRHERNQSRIVPCASTRPQWITYRSIQIRSSIGLIILHHYWLNGIGIVQSYY